MDAIAQAKQTKHCLSRQIPRYDKKRDNMFSHLAINVRIHDRFACIAMSGHFNFQAHRDFRQSYMPLLCNADVHEICVEMSGVDYLDISALGMLMLFSERAKAANKSVTLHIAPGVVSQALEVANFSKAFNIRHISAKNCGIPSMNALIIKGSPIAS